MLLMLFISENMYVNHFIHKCQKGFDMYFSFSEDHEIGNREKNLKWTKCSVKRVKIDEQKLQFLP